MAATITPDVTVYWFGPQVRAELTAEVRKRLLIAALMVERSAKESMAEQKHGRWYLKGSGSDAIYQASAPGEAPAIRTGVLQSGVTHTYPKMGIDGWMHCYVGSDEDYGLYLELGVGRFVFGSSRASAALTGDWRIAPRPWLRPALDKNRAAIGTLFRTPLKP